MGDSFRNERLYWCVLLATLLSFCLAWTSHAQFVEGFESGDFSAVPWSATGDAYWRITDENPIAGSYSAYARGTGSGIAWCISAVSAWKTRSMGRSSEGFSR